MSLSSNDKIKCLYNWCVNQTRGYTNVEIKNFTSSWRNGLGFCAILHQYGPEFIDFDALKPDNVFENCQMAFQVGEKHFGIPALLDAKDMVIMKVPDRLSIITYLLQYYSTLAPKKTKVATATGGPLFPIENINNDRLTEDKAIDQLVTDQDQEQRDHLKCEICSQIIYFLEKLAISDKYYHRSCYRQTQLSNLKKRNLTLERPKPAESTAVDNTNDRKSRLKSPTESNKSAFWPDSQIKTENIENDNNNLLSFGVTVSNEKEESKKQNVNETKNKEDNVKSSLLENLEKQKIKGFSDKKEKPGKEINKKDDALNVTEVATRKMNVGVGSQKGHLEVSLISNNEVKDKKDLEGTKRLNERDPSLKIGGDQETTEYKRIDKKKHDLTTNVKEETVKDKEDASFALKSVKSSPSKDLEKPKIKGFNDKKEEPRKEINKKDDVVKVTEVDISKLNLGDGSQKGHLEVSLISNYEVKHKKGIEEGKHSNENDQSLKIVDQKETYDQETTKEKVDLTTNVKEETDKTKKDESLSVKKDITEELNSKKVLTKDEGQHRLAISQRNDQNKLPSSDQKPVENKTNNSNIEMVNYPRKLSLRSLSPETNRNRPPSLDGHLEKISLQNSPSKTFNQIFTDRSSPSGSSVNYVSVNASSTDSLSIGQMVVGDTVKDEVSRFSKGLHPDSLNLSSSSLNSSFSKKRHAPPPPPPSSSQSPSTVSAKSPIAPLKPRKVFLKTGEGYPEDRNPFAEAKEKEQDKNDTNPFSEYMTEKAIEEQPTIQTPNPKPRKRVAPKVPPRPTGRQETRSPEIRNYPASLNLNGNPNLMSTTQHVSKRENIQNTVNISSNEVIEVPVEKSPVVATKDEKSYDIKPLETTKKPELLKRTKHLMEKSKSNDALDLLGSSRNNKQKPPAPSRPPPKKREVRGDTTHEFIPYECLYSELEEVNTKQSEMEIKGRSLQDALKGVTEKDERYEALMQDWLDIVEKKNAMYSREHHLHEILRRQELEDRHSDLEFELRVLMGKQESLKTAAEKAREEELIAQIVDTVNARAKMYEEDAESSGMSSTNEAPKQKSTLRKIFSSKHRSNSLGKNIFSIKMNKKIQKTKTFRSIFYEDK